MQTDQKILQGWLDSGRLASPVIFDNAVVRANGNPVPSTNGPTVYDENGWGLNNHSALGGRRSAAFDNIRVWLTNHNHTDILAFVPEFHGAYFWLKPCDFMQFAKPDPAMYVDASPSDIDAIGYTREQYEQLVDNVQAVMGRLFQTGVMSGDAEHYLNSIYRGELGKQGYSPVVPGTDQLNFSPPPLHDVVGNPYTNDWPYQLRTGRHYDRHYRHDVNGMQLPEYTKVAVGPALQNHAFYDRWTDAQTDENPAREILSWINAHGIAIPMNPVGFRNSAEPI